MILICTKEDIKIEDSLELSGLKLTHCPGEMQIYIANSKVLKDEVLLFKCNESIVQCKVGIKWSLDNYNQINSSIFIGFIKPINSAILKNQVVIPSDLSNINQTELEWSRGIISSSIKIESLQQKTIRYSVYKSNLDFSYARIVSLNNNPSKYIIEELKLLNKFDGINNLCFTINDVLASYKIDVYNILIGDPKEYLSSKKIQYKTVFENLILDIK